MTSNSSQPIFPPDATCLANALAEAYPFSEINSSCSITDPMISFLNLTNFDDYFAHYCLNPPDDDGCPYGFCPNSDIAGWVYLPYSSSDSHQHPSSRPTHPHICIHHQCARRWASCVTLPPVVLMIIFYSNSDLLSTRRAQRVFLVPNPECLLPPCRLRHLYLPTSAHSHSFHPHHCHRRITVEPLYRHICNTICMGRRPSHGCHCWPRQNHP
jgi:hypothetical protein